jgi:hypothetical protein
MESFRSLSLSCTDAEGYTFHHAWGRTYGFWRFMLDMSHGAEGIGMVNKRLDVRLLIAEAI